MSVMYDDSELPHPYIVEFNATTHEIYYAFAKAGCNAAILVKDDWDRESHWTGLVGTPEQIAASYHESNHYEASKTSVERILDLTRPVSEQFFASSNGKDTELQKAIASHDPEAFKNLSVEEKVAATARLIFI